MTIALQEQIFRLRTFLDLLSLTWLFRYIKMVMQMDKYRKTFNVFEQIKSVKRILEPLAPDGGSFRLRGLVMRCAKYRVGQVKKLKGLEARAYDLLLNQKLNPKTVYEWLLLEDVPQHIKEKIVQRKVNLQDARREYVQWKRMNSTRAGKELMEEIQTVIRRLRWKSQEGLPTQYFALDLF